MENKKNEKYDLERKRPLFFGIGMIISLTLTLVAFEWKSPVDPVVEYMEPEEDVWFVMDEVQITKQKLPEIPKPKKEIKKQVVATLDKIKEVKQLTKIFEPAPIEDIDDDIIDDIGGTETIEVPDNPFIVVEDMPKFPGGDAALLGFIAKNIRYPKQAQRIGVEGKVHLSFVIDKDGSVTDIKVVKGIGAGCDEEAVRVLKLLPKFSPGKQRGNPVRVQMQLPVNFQLR